MKKRSLCNSCYEEFIADTATTLPLRDGRTVTKKPPKSTGKRSTITIANFTLDISAEPFYPIWDEAEEFFSYDVPLFPSTMTSSKFPPTTIQFAHLDSCAGIGAGGGNYFIGNHTPVQYNVHGVNATADFQLSKSQTCALMLTDAATGDKFLGLYGGMLRAGPALITDLILSTGQMSDLWIDIEGRQGARAHLPDRNSSWFEISGGRRCTVVRRRGVPGVLGKVLSDTDP